MRLWRRRSWLLKKTEIAWVRTGKYLRLKSKRLGFTCWIQAPGPHELNDLRSEFALHRRTKHQYFFSIPLGPLTWARTPPAPRRRPVWCSARATPWSSPSLGWRWCTPPTGRCSSPYWRTRGRQWSGRYSSSQSERSIFIVILCEKLFVVFCLCIYGMPLTVCCGQKQTMKNFFQNKLNVSAEKYILYQITLLSIFSPDPWSPWPTTSPVAASRIDRTTRIEDEEGKDRDDRRTANHLSDYEKRKMWEGFDEFPGKKSTDADEVI